MRPRRQRQRQSRPRTSTALPSESATILSAASRTVAHPRRVSNRMSPPICSGPPPPRSHAGAARRAAARGASPARASRARRRLRLHLPRSQRPAAERLGPVRPRAPSAVEGDDLELPAHPCRWRPARRRAGRGCSTSSRATRPFGSSSKCASRPSTSAWPDAKKSMVSSSTAYSRSNVPTNDDAARDAGQAVDERLVAELDRVGAPAAHLLDAEAKPRGRVDDDLLHQRVEVRRDAARESTAPARRDTGSRCSC